jgi:hypothetical protein
MARQKQIIAKLKASGADVRGAERALHTLSACLRVIEDQWLALLEKQHHEEAGGFRIHRSSNATSKSFFVKRCD